METGEIVSNTPARKPQDIFHSRLEMSPDNKYLLTKGWFWHPWDTIELFDIEKCLSDPTLLDNGITMPNVTTEICAASFIDNTKILVCASNEESLNDENKEPIPPGHIAIWNIETNEISKPVKVQGEFGNIFAIDDKRCWDLYNYPKIIALTKGNIIDKIETINSGEQRSSIIHHLDDLPKIAFNKETKRIAIAKNHKIDILTA